MIDYYYYSDGYYDVRRHGSSLLDYSDCDDYIHLGSGCGNFHAVAVEEKHKNELVYSEINVSSNFQAGRGTYEALELIASLVEIVALFHFEDALVGIDQVCDLVD